MPSMDGFRSLAGPIAVHPIGERRRRIRQKLHTPVYASFNGPQTGMVVDLSELLDLHEEGFAVQTSQRLEVNRAVTVCLDLPETKSYIHCTGQVIWSDDVGRGGVRFSALSQKSRQALKEWLFGNLMIGCSNHSARSEQLATRQPESSELSESLELKEKESPDVAPNMTPNTTTGPRIVPLSEGSATLAAVEAVRLVVREIGDDFDAILQLVTERALSFTGATGAALALLTDGQMICRSRAGEQAPPLGAAVDGKHGLSGECVRSGVLVSCADTSNDPRVEPEVCRALNIGSLMAAPIVSDLQVIGLLEIFSPQPRRFTRVHGTVLERLIELIPRPGRNDDEKEPEATGAQSNVGLTTATGVASDSDTVGSPSSQFASIYADREAFFEPETEAHAEENFEPALSTSSRSGYRPLYLLVVLAVFVVLGYLIAPVIDKRYVISPQASQRVSSAGGTTGSTLSGQNTGDSQTKYLSDLQKLAEQGNTEAEWQLGARYHTGEGVPKDDAQAMHWFELAGEQGNVSAQSTLGAYYAVGRGVPQDLSKAYFWSAVALAQGDEISKPRLQGLSSQMSRQQILDARQQAEGWLRSHSVRAKTE